MINTQTDWWWGTTPKTMFRLMCRCWWHKVEFVSVGFGACQDLMLDMMIVKLIICSSVAACDWPWEIFGFWKSLEIHIFCLPLLGLGTYIKDKSAHKGRLLPALSIRVSQQKTQNTPISSSAYRLLVRLSHRKSPWLYSSAGHKLPRVGTEELQRMGLLLSPKLMLHRGECSAYERWLLRYGEIAQQRNHCGWPFSSLLRATNPHFSSCGSSPLCPFSTGA